MPRKSEYPGVERRGKKLRIWFMYEGQKVHEAHPSPPTIAGLKAAARDRAKIVSQIELGTFNYHEWFPGSPRATRTMPSFNEVAETWVHRKRPELEKSTLDEYVKKINAYWLPYIANIPIAEITTGMLRDIAADLTQIAAKTYNDSLTPLRGIFECAIDDGLISANPAAKLKNRPRIKQKPDPLTGEQMGRVLEWIKKKEPEWWPYFAIAFDTGLRTSELIALRITDVDVDLREIQVRRAYVRQQLKAPKDHEVRDVEFGELTREAVRIQRAKVALREDRLLLPSPINSKIINNDKPPRLVWTRALRSLQIRHRPAYNTRHTFATVALMNGVNIGWVSRQLGHSTVKMTTDHYATFIPKADNGEERRKLNRALSG